MAIDKNFHVRTISELKSKITKKDTLIPSPSTKTKIINITRHLSSWIDLELELKTDGIRYFLKMDENISSMFIKKLEINSTLKSVVCKANITVSEKSSQVEFIAEWLRVLCDYIEIASSLWIDMIPLILNYIDKNAFRRILEPDRVIIGIFIDSASVIVPNISVVNTIVNFGSGLLMKGIVSDDLVIFVKSLLIRKEYNLKDIINKLVPEMEKSNILQEELPFYLFHIFILDGFEYYSSYIKSV